MLPFLLALAPILLILILMLGLRWGASRAGGIGYLSALLIAILFFGAGPRLLAYAHSQAVLLSMDVLLIIWAAFLLFRVSDEAGAIAAIGRVLPHLTANRNMQALIIGWVFSSFLQGVSGFGVPVAVIAPILIGLGFSPLAAVLVPSVGHGWTVTFGSLGSSFQALMVASGLPATLLAPPSALFLGCAGILSGLMAAHAAGGWQAVRSLALPILILGLTMSTVQYLAATSGFWNIGAFSGGMAGLLVGVPLARRFADHKQPLESFDLRSLGVALSAYAVLILVILAVQFIEPLKVWLSQITIRLEFPETRTALGFVNPAGSGRVIFLLRHTGFLLGYASLISYLIYRRAGLYTPGAARRIITGTAGRVTSSSLSIASMVSMAVIMEQSGMTATLASGLAQGVGAFFPIAAPWIGALGAFITGSNTNSNVVFAALQLHTAQLLGFSAPLILAGQTAGAAIASIIAPAKVVVGASTAGLSGREGEVMRKMALYTGLLVLSISLFTLLGTALQFAGH